MPKINVYLPDELADAVKQANLPVSAICQRALEQAVRRVTALNETMRGSTDTNGDVANQIQQLSKFTGRAKVVLAMAVEAARADDRPVDTAHLLSAFVDEGDGVGPRVLRALEIDPQELAAALALPRSSAVAPDRGETGFAPDAKEALRLTVAEAAGLGHSYVGTEHLLLGLIAEPDGVAGQLLRGGGAELRLTRRAVKAALAGWVARNEAAMPAAGAEVLPALTDAIRAELGPIVDRLDRLEQRVSG